MLRVGACTIKATMQPFRPVSAVGHVIAALALVTAVAHAQTVDEIVAKNIEAKGGVALLEATTSVRLVARGSMQVPGTAQGTETRITSLMKRPYLFRNEMELSGQKLIQGFDGTTLWMSVGGMPAQVLPAGPQTEALKSSSQIDPPLLNYKEKGTKIELAEPETANGRTLHHLIVTPKVGPPMHYYVDAETNLEAKMVIDTEEQGQKMRMEMRFSDFKEIDGRTVPFLITQYVNGQRVGQMIIENVEFNVPMEDSLFRMPK
jgi:outer membrane lipoprotein-sorting protein